MIIGHYAVGFIAKKMAPNISLGTFTLAAVWLDLVMAVLLLMGTEQIALEPTRTQAMPVEFLHFPYSHGFLAALLWSLGFGLAYWAIRRKRVIAALLTGCVFSHWWLDALVHRQDLPLAFFGSTRVGLGFWDSILVTSFLEGGLLFVGLAIYLRRFQPRTSFGPYLLLAYLSVLGAGFLLPILGYVPPTANAVAALSLGNWFLVAFAYLLDHHFEAKIPVLNVATQEAA